MTRTQTCPCDRPQSAGAVATPSLLVSRAGVRVPCLQTRELRHLEGKIIFSPNKRLCSKPPAKPQIPGGLKLAFTQDTQVQSHQVAVNLSGTDRLESVEEKHFLQSRCPQPRPCHSSRNGQSPRKPRQSYIVENRSLQGPGGLLREGEPSQGWRGTRCLWGPPEEAVTSFLSWQAPSPIRQPQLGSPCRRYPSRC